MGQFIKGSSQKRAISLRSKASFLDAPRGFSRASQSKPMAGKRLFVSNESCGMIKYVHQILFHHEQVYIQIDIRGWVTVYVLSSPSTWFSMTSLRESRLADEFIVTWMPHSLESSSLTDKTETRAFNWNEGSEGEVICNIWWILSFLYLHRSFYKYIRIRNTLTAIVGWKLRSAFFTFFDENEIFSARSRRVNVTTDRAELIDSNDKRSGQSASKRSCPHTVIVYYVTLCTILHLNVLILQNIVYVEMRLLSPDLFEDLYATRNIDPSLWGFASPTSSISADRATR